MKPNRYILLNAITGDEITRGEFIHDVIKVIGCSKAHVYKQSNGDDLTFTYKKVKYKIIDRLMY